MNMKQLIWNGEPTAKSRIFEMWDEGYDEFDWVIEAEFNVTRTTVDSYRAEWRRLLLGAHGDKNPVVYVDALALPYETPKGIVWNKWTGYETRRLTCTTCAIARECNKMVPLGGYLGCERLLQSEEDDRELVEQRTQSPELAWAMIVARVAVKRVQSRAKENGRVTHPTTDQIPWPDRGEIPKIVW